MTVRRLAAACLLVGSAGSLLVGCGDDAADGAYQRRRAAALAVELPPPVTSSAGPAAPGVEPTGVVVPVVALDNSFRPAIVEIAVGDTVIWENRGMNEHDVLYVEGDDWGVAVEEFQPGAVYRHVFTEPGEYRYYCSIHGSADVGMVGTVVVSG